jgi:NAD(P)-dependent dehydrogenase (short-subunit alcohol dehydrogenase family)
MSSKRSILITGCSDGGLGCALALAMHKAGWFVIASARDTSRLKETTAAGIKAVQLDITSKDSIDACAKAVQELTGGELNALLNNAGGGYNMPFVDLDVHQVRQLFELNTFSLVPLVHTFLPLLQKSKAGGLIINNTSIASRINLPFQSAYNASKAASAAFTEGLRIELAPFNIRVVELVTGSIKTNFFQNVAEKTLPPGSIYSIAAEPIEKYMGGAMNAKDGSDPNHWAERVAALLSSQKPPHQIWLGRHASEARLSRLLPTGWLDGVMESMAGLDVLRKRIQEAGNPN